MSSRIGHWLKHNARSATPKHHIFLATDCRPHGYSPNEYELGSYSVRKAHWSGGRLYYTQSLCDVYGDGIWDIVHSMLPRRGKTIIWCIDPRWDLQLTRFFDCISRGEFARNYWVWRDPPIIVDGSLRGRRCTILGLDNWCPDYGQRLRLALPLAHDSAPNPLRTGRCDLSVSQLRCAALMHAVERVLRLHASEDLGNFRSTFAAQSLQVYRHRFLPGGIGIHNNDAATALEREVPLIPPVVHPIGVCTYDSVTILDCNALYPHAMSAYPYPRRLNWYAGDTRISRLKELSQCSLLVARVGIRSRGREYCCRQSGLVEYRRDADGVVLCGQELCQALDDDAVEYCDECASYEPAGLFCAWSEWAMSLRERCRAGNNRVDRELSKTLTNALWGRFAARTEVWLPYSECPAPYQWGYFFHRPGHCKDAKLCRAIAGQVEIRSGVHEGRDSMAAIAAMVAANSRCHMDRLVSIAGAENVHYRVADALHVSTEGLWRLAAAGVVHGSRWGLLKIVSRHDRIVYHGANVYVADGVLTRAGVPLSADVAPDGSAVWRETDRCGLVVRNGATGTVRVRQMSSVKIGE